MCVSCHFGLFPLIFVHWLWTKRKCDTSKQNESIVLTRCNQRKRESKKVWMQSAKQIPKVNCGKHSQLLFVPYYYFHLFAGVSKQNRTQLFSLFALCFELTWYRDTFFPVSDFSKTCVRFSITLTTLRRLCNFLSKSSSTRKSCYSHTHEKHHPMLFTPRREA